MCYLPFSGIWRRTLCMDTDESIPEVDINLKLNIQPYQFKLVKRHTFSHNNRDDERDSESNEPADACDADLPPDMHWYMYVF